MKITIHQPEHLPWLGLINKINQVDMFVILDVVQFEKNNFQNRNRIRTNSGKGFSWLTVPVKKHSLKTKIKDIEISNDFNWKDGYLNTIKENYKNSKYFGKYFIEIENIIYKNHKKLIDLNMELILFLLEELNVKTKLIKASEIGLPNVLGGNNVIISICKKLNADEYLSGAGGKEYLDLSLFKKENIEITFQDFKHPKYNQQFPPFIENMSAIDLLLNIGFEEIVVPTHQK